MRIISKQRDYYDCVMKHAAGDPNVFVRMKSEVEVNASNLSETIKGLMIEFWNNPPTECRPFNLQTVMIGFCGKVYPALQVTYTIDKWIDSKTDTFYNVEEYRNFIQHYAKISGNKKIVDYYYKKSKSRYSWHRPNSDTDISISSFFDKWHGSEKFSDLFFQLKSPVFILKKERKRDEFSVSSYDNSIKGIFEFCIDTPIDQYKFHKVFDTYSAYQEIEMYYFGVLGCTEVDMVNISDLDMRNQKGFDKWSFKKI